MKPIPLYSSTLNTVCKKCQFSENLIKYTRSYNSSGIAPTFILPNFYFLVFNKMTKEEHNFVFELCEILANKERGMQP